MILMDRIGVPDVPLDVYLFFIFVLPTQNFELKNVYESENLKNNKPPAEHQGSMFCLLKSFAANQNLVRLSL